MTTYPSQRRGPLAWLPRGVLLAAGLLACPLAHPARAADPGSWMDQATKLNSRVVSSQEAAKIGAKEKVDTRNKICVRRIRPAAATDWNADPTAIPFMLYQVNKRTELPIHVNNEGLDVAGDELFDHLVVYLTSHGSWGFNERETANMTTWLKRGGTLLLDDCYNKGSPFADCVAPEVAKMIPGAKPVMLLGSDKRVADAFSMIYPTPVPGQNIQLGRPWQFFMLDDRPAVFFTPNDDGCGWEVSNPPSASNPIGEGIGHGGDNLMRERFYQWITNWLMFVYSS